MNYSSDKICIDEKKNVFNVLTNTNSRPLC